MRRHCSVCENLLLDTVLSSLETLGDIQFGKGLRTELRNMLAVSGDLTAQNHWRHPGRHNDGSVQFGQVLFWQRWFALCCPRCVFLLLRAERIDHVNYFPLLKSDILPKQFERWRFLLLVFQISSPSRPE